MVQTVHTARRTDTPTGVDQLHLWGGVALVAVSIIILIMVGR